MKTTDAATEESSLTETVRSSDKKRSTTSAAKKSEDKSTTVTADNRGVSANETGTHPTESSAAGRSSSKNTTGNNSSARTTSPKSTTAKKTTTVKTTTTPPAAKNSKRMALYDVYQLSLKGSALTWSDFDPYIGEDVGSGIYIYKYNILDGYTLYVMGVPPKAPDKIWLYKGTDAPIDGEHIDIRYEDINEFINSEQVLKDKEMLYKEIHPDSVSRIQVTSSSGKSTELSYPEVKSLVSLLKGRDLLRKNSGYEVLSLNRYDINISYYGVGPLQQRETNISIIGDYLIINGESYICEGSSDNINRFLYSVTNHDEPRYVEVGNGEVWCWNNFMKSNVSVHDYYEKIIISAFPDIVFTWNGMNESGIMLERNGEKIITLGGMPLWSAFFTDLNGDGYPEICSSLSIGSGIIDTRVGVYDIKNKRHYELEGRMDEIDYFLFMENGELFVNKQSANIGWAPLSANGEKGRLAIENDTLVFKPV
ncbi:MAG: hypothetical protein BWZ04_00979 [Firmicutes bacterium ADurb.BinA205]|nr:MAG: hypothetical protein BWZ04_00979 [Firmicutes bacterium ADurb.BinA205]